MSAISSSLQADAAVELTATSPMDRDAIAALLVELGQRVGIDGLTLGADGTAILTLDDELEIWLSHQTGFAGITVTAPLPDDPDARPQLARRLLQANLDWHATAGGSFCLLPDSGLLALCRRLSMADRDIDRIAIELANFVSLANSWMREIALFSDLYEEPAANTASAGLPHSGAIRA